MLTGQSWISTGRGGRAVVTIGQEQVEIDENSLWEWSGNDDGSAGNTIQGRMRVGTALPKGRAVPDSAPDDATPRLYRKAPWMLILDAGEEQAAAQRLVGFLKNSGYPVDAAQQVRLKSGVVWQIWLQGLATRAAALALGTQLMALAPAIFSATPEQNNEPVAPSAQEEATEKKSVEQTLPEKTADPTPEPKW